MSFGIFFAINSWRVKPDTAADPTRREVFRIDPPEEGHVRRDAWSPGLRQGAVRRHWGNTNSTERRRSDFPGVRLKRWGLIWLELVDA